LLPTLKVNNITAENNFLATLTAVVADKYIIYHIGTVLQYLQVSLQVDWTGQAGHHFLSLLMLPIWFTLWSWIQFIRTDTI